ncbi:MAG: OadG family protein [Pontibacterium sp.]
MDNIVSEGLNLMVFGMGFVFVFLTLLVFVTTGMSAFVSRFFPAPAPVPAKKAAPAPTKSANDDQLVAVISAAVHQYRSK